MKFKEPTKLHRKSGMWGTRRLVAGKSPKAGTLTLNLLTASPLIEMTRGIGAIVAGIEPKMSLHKNRFHHHGGPNSLPFSS
jgi:hypothetical protein